MKASRALLVVLIALACAPVTLAAADAPPSDGEAWYKVVTGIIAIPAAAIGFVISLQVLRKTTLESRKLELELQQKSTTAESAQSEQETLQTIARPVTDSNRALLLVLRFIVLEVTLRLWDIVPSGFGFVTRVVPTAVLMFYRSRIEEIDFWSWPILSAAVAPALISTLFSIVYWSIVFGFGWPLLKDTCRFLNINIKSFWDLPFVGRQRPAATDV
jgi:hypothetical protein